jgi:methylglutaconyl-CoA hydratase
LTLQTLELEISSRRIATVRLNRPDRGNAFDQTMLDELGEALTRFAAEEAVRLVVLRGNGRHFCAGADLAGRSAAGAAPPTHSLRDVLALLDAMPKPVLAVVHGAAVGGGAAFAACCDCVIATDAAFFSVPEVRVGMPPLGVAPFLVRAMGPRQFRRYGLSGERIGAAEAQRIGLAHEVCSAESLEETLERVADAFLHGAPGAVGTLKAAVAQLATEPAGALPGHDAKTAEALEGIASFREKRKPSWYPQ